jgi:hypothetical protein
LSAVADSGDGLLGIGEVLDDCQHPWRQAQVFGRSAAGYDERVVGLFVNVVKGGRQAEVVPALFAVGLLAFEVVNCRGD